MADDGSMGGGQGSGDGGDVFACLRDFELDPAAKPVHIRVHYLQRWRARTWAQGTVGLACGMRACARVALGDARRRWRPSDAPVPPGA